jgi:hypothetical protein
MDDKMTMDRRHLLAAMGSLLATPAMAQVQLGEREKNDEPGQGGGDGGIGEMGGGPIAAPEFSALFKFILYLALILQSLVAGAAAAWGGFFFKAALAAGTSVAYQLGLAGIAGALAALGGAGAANAKFLGDAAADPPRKDWDQPVAPIKWKTADPVDPVEGFDDEALENVLNLTQSILDFTAVIAAFLEAREKATGALKAGDEYYIGVLEGVLADLRPQVLWHLEDVLMRTDAFARDLPYWFGFLKDIDSSMVCSEEYMFPEMKAAYEKNLYAVDVDYESNLPFTSYERIMAQNDQIPFALLLANVESQNKRTQRLMPSMLEELKRML